MQIGNIIIKPWDRHNFIYRMIALLLVAAWLGWGVTIFLEGREINARLQSLQEEKMRQEERARRAAAYRQALEQQRHSQNKVKNAIDGVK